jgi:transketolase
MPLDPVADKWKAFGWHVIEIDGHSVREIISALDEARTIKGKPTMVIAHTIKGKGMPEIENRWQSHAISDFSSESAKELVKNLSCEL